MGRDKALIELNGKPLIEHALERVSGLAEPILVVADRADRYTLPGAICVGDDMPGEGPLAGVVTGLRAAGAGAHLVVACDMPHLQRDLMRTMLLSVSDFQVVAGRVDGHTMPLCAVYTQQVLRTAERLLETGERALRCVPEACKTRWLDEVELRQYDPDLLSYRNLNTPQDIRNWRETA